MKIWFRRLLLVLIIMVFVTPGLGRAEEKLAKVGEFPKAPLVFIVPFGYGGGFDTFTRTLSMQMVKLSPVPITVLNVAGAGASRAMVYTQQQEADGYTILGLEASQLISEHKIDYKVLNDFDFVCRAVSDSLQIYVAKDSPFKTFKDLVEYAKANPKKLKIGSNDAGGSLDLQVHYIFDVVGAEVTYVPYEHAATKGRAATLSGKLDAYYDVIGSWPSVLDSGKARALVTTSPQRIEAYPDIPTFKELGYDITVGIYRGFAVKKGTPPERIEFIRTLVKKSLETEEFKKAAKKLNLEINFSGAEEFRSFIEKQKKIYTEIGKKLGYF